MDSFLLECENRYLQEQLQGSVLSGKLPAAIKTNNPNEDDNVDDVDDDEQLIHTAAGSVLVICTQDAKRDMGKPEELAEALAIECEWLTGHSGRRLLFGVGRRRRMCKGIAWYRGMPVKRTTLLIILAIIPSCVDVSKARGGSASKKTLSATP